MLSGASRGVVLARVGDDLELLGRDPPRRAMGSW
jgi:hypothetical protein